MNKTKNIMLIDDNKIDLFVSQKIIEKLNKNIKIRAFVNPISAINHLKIIETQHEIKTMFVPDIIFLDINMPKMDGFQFLNEFNQIAHLKNEKIRIYMLSSSTNCQDTQKVKNDRSCFGFLNKPLTTESLKRLLIEFKPYLKEFDFDA